MLLVLPNGIFRRLRGLLLHGRRKIPATYGNSLT
jgi:hypothetical protein